MNRVKKRAFTLIEVLVSVFLVFIIGLTLTKISSQNINTIQSTKDDLTYLYSTIVNSTNEYRDINDYLSIKDIPKYKHNIDKKTTFLSTSSFFISDNFIVNYTLEKVEVKDDKQTKTFFHIK